MKTYDFSPLFRSTVGFDRVMNMLDSISSVDDSSNGYPPYNIEKTGEDAYRISMAVAGFTPDELSLETQNGRLLVTGVPAEQEAKPQLLHHGIARRRFRRVFQLADYVNVKGADIRDGMLNIDLVREIPEAMKPRQISIAANNAPRQVEATVDAKSKAA